MSKSLFPRGQKTALPLIVLILIVIQPVMDVISFWVESAGAGNTLTLLLRLAVLVFTVLAGFLLSERKRAWVILAAVLVLLTAGHAAFCVYYGYDAPLSDLTNLIRIYQLPLITFAFISFLRRDERCIEVIPLGFGINLVIILLVGLLATLTGTDPHTYANKGIGMLGWFSNTSAQSAILSMIVPIVLALALRQKKRQLPRLLAACLLGFGALYLFATRLAYVALLGCAFGMAVCCLIITKTGKLPLKKAALVFAAFGVAALLLAGVSPMQANLDKVGDNAILKQQDIDALVAADTAAAEDAGLTGDALRLASLKSAYEKYLPGVTGRFGLERTAERYGYSTQMEQLSNARLQKINYARMLLEEQPLSALFGLELNDLTYGDATYDTENDFHGILFLCGWAGLILLAAFLLCFLLRIVRALIRSFSSTFTPAAAGCGIALICGLAHACFTAGVLRRPNANFYLAVILAAVYALTEKTSEKGELK